VTNEETSGETNEETNRETNRETNEENPQPNGRFLRRLLNGYSDLGPGGRATVIAALIAAVSTIAAALLPLLQADGDAQPDGTPKAGGSSPPDGAAASRAAKPLPTAATSPPSRQCRDTAYAHGSLSVRPCIQRGRDGLDITSEVAFQQAGNFTVFVWLRTNVRLEETLQTCHFRLTEPGETKTCGPHHVRPENPNTYVAATIVQQGMVEFPKLWKDPGGIGILSGLQSEGITWPPR
jgi:hypothetical protein